MHYEILAVIDWELCKKMKFDYSTKWYMQKLESVQENKTDKILNDFEIQMIYLILARRPELVWINKKKRTCHLIDFVVSADHWVEITTKAKKMNK